MTVGANTFMIFFFFLKHFNPQLFVPLEFIVGKISLYHIPIHINNFSTPG